MKHSLDGAIDDEENLRRAAELLTVLANEIAEARSDATSADLLTRRTGPKTRFASRYEAHDGRFVSMARQEIATRDRRSKFFEIDLIGEPGWMILLDLFIQNFEGRVVSVTSACIASGVPPTTALRYIGILEKHGYIVKKKSETDQRIFFLTVSESCIDNLRKFFSEEILHSIPNANKSPFMLG